MSPFRPVLAWLHTDGLRLHVREVDPSRRRVVAVPAALSTALLDPSAGGGVTDSPAVDLIQLEARIRLERAHLNGLLHTSQIVYANARSDVEALRGRHGIGARRERRRLAGVLGDAERHRSDLTGLLSVTIARQDEVRSFVQELAISEGPLAIVAEGWRRDPARPAHVNTFDSENLFLFTNPQRAVTAFWGGQVIDCEEFGTTWRRDGDDDSPHGSNPSLLGWWRVGYIEATGEVFATRRCPHLPEEVWLLGTGFTDGPECRRLLADLEEHMGEPNSIILAAERVRDASPTTAATGVRLIQGIR